MKYDSLIFDMDGTLWDAANLYAASWNSSFKKNGLDLQLSREDIGALTGLERSDLIDKIMPGYEASICDRVILDVETFTRQLLPETGGQLYQDVQQGLAALSRHYKLFIVSNCDAGVIRLFMDWAKINDWITDEVAHGINFKPKHHNIQLLIDKHQLQHPIYIGDTDGDSKQSKLAGIPFAFVSYGFGQTSEYQLKFDGFKELSDHFLL
ncbi:HAD family hydrolase [Pedobacter gandavensis]|uniref:HAD family hydrolase n=1 Tax=Pedobacter TaxID=84567 RepID=UPI001C99B253|nr:MULTISPECIES: HAD family hydrolase [Pedobacter]WGQ11357.1 HAD family hydrolase [Pedobacter gandavensis]